MKVTTSNHTAFLILFSITFFFCHSVKGQTYTSYFTGDTSDVSTITAYGACLMGGGSEHDNAMKWFLNLAGGGDIVVIRSTGSDGYNNYLYSSLGLTVNSVETIIIPSAAAANDPYVEQQLRNAEAIWIAGGDQNNYVSFWKNTLVDSAINDHVNIKKAPIGGTSAGMAILGSHYFSAANGSITSATALGNPFHSNVTIGGKDFLHLPFLENVITDTHYDNPDRKGRHFTFMARISSDDGIRSFGIACDEYTAVCIDSTGKASVYGEYPSYDDNAYFLQANCVPPYQPETCLPSSNLTWDRNNQAVKVYAVKGDLNGTKYLNLNDWQTGSGGTWENWYVVNGQLDTGTGAASNCSGTIIFKNPDEQKIVVFPNPSIGILTVTGFGDDSDGHIFIYDMFGRVVYHANGKTKDYSRIDLAGLSNGIYLLHLNSKTTFYKNKFALFR